MPEELRLGPVARRLAAHERVLIVDDDRERADFLRAYFRSAGYDFVHAEPRTALELLQLLEEHRPHCVLLSTDARDVDGLDAYHRVHADDRFAALPVIILSRQPDAIRLRARTRAIDAIVPQPGNVNDLADLVAERIAHTRGLHELVVGEPVADIVIAAVVPDDAPLSVAI